VLNKNFPPCNLTPAKHCKSPESKQRGSRKKEKRVLNETLGTGENVQRIKYGIRSKIKVSYCTARKN